MKRYPAFFIPYFLFVVTLVVLILFNQKGDLHLWITSFNSPAADVFFHYYTFVGDWIPYVFVAGLLFYRYRIALFVLVSQLATGLVSIIIKQTWNEPRPVLYFKEHFPTIQLHQIAGEHMHFVHSFPSGHTITAFSFFLALSFYTKRKSLHFLYFVLALLVGYSRIYLSQHFAIDVLVGSVIGVTITIICWYYFDKNIIRKSLYFLYFMMALLIGYSWIYISQHFAINVLVGSAVIGVAATIVCRYYLDKTPVKWADGSLRDVFLRKKDDKVELLK